MTSQPLFLNTDILERLKVANFADMKKIATMFIKTIFEDLSTIKIIKEYAITCNFYLYLLI